MTMAGEDGILESLSKTNVRIEAGEAADLHNDTEEEKRPPLPPRPTGLQSPPPRPSSPTNLVSRTTGAKRPQLQSQPTTALSSVDIQTLSFPDGTRGTFSTSSDHPNLAPISGSGKVSQNGSEIDSASVTSLAPTPRVGGDLESLLGNGFNTQSPAWKLLHNQTDSENQFGTIEFDEDDRLSSFEHEFDEVADIDSKGGNEGQF